MIYGLNEECGCGKRGVIMELPVARSVESNIQFDGFDLDSLTWKISRKVCVAAWVAFFMSVEDSSDSTGLE